MSVLKCLKLSNSTCAVVLYIKKTEEVGALLLYLEQPNKNMPAYSTANQDKGAKIK